MAASTAPGLGITLRRDVLGRPVVVVSSALGAWEILGAVRQPARPF